MSIKKISDLNETTELSEEDIVPVVNSTTLTTEKIQIQNLFKSLFTKCAGAHNSVYRGKDITDLFYDGTLSKQIAAGTFDDIFVGDYIVGKESGNVYIVADIDYRFITGDTNLTKHHLLLVPLASMGSTPMNSSDTTAGAYVGSEMYTTNLEPFKTIIQNDFTIDETSHILTHRQYLSNSVSSSFENGALWIDSDIELMNERMVYGNMPFTNILNGTTSPQNRTIDKSQLSLFRFRPDLIMAKRIGETNIESTNRATYWLRDVVSSSTFACVYDLGTATCLGASNSFGVRPAFLIV